MLFERIKLETDEEVIRIIYKHWFIILSQTVISVLMALLPLLLWWLLTQPFITAELALDINLYAYGSEMLFLFFWWLLMIFLSLAHVYTNYYLDIWVVTNRRIIVIDQVSLFKRTIGSFRYERLQDISVEIDGVIPTFLDFGTIRATTASGNEAFHTDLLPHPRDIKSLVLTTADARMRLRNH